MGGSPAPWPESADLKPHGRASKPTPNAHRPRLVASLQAHHRGSLRVKCAYLDGELCALNSDGEPTFSGLQAAMDEGRAEQLIFFVYDLLLLNGASSSRTKRL